MEKDYKKKIKKAKKTLQLISKELKKYAEDNIEDDKFQVNRYSYAFNSDFKTMKSNIDKRINKRYSNEKNDFL